MAPSVSGDPLQFQINEAYKIAHSSTTLPKGQRRVDNALDKVSDSAEEGTLGFVNQFYEANKELLTSTAYNIASMEMDSKAVNQAIYGFSETAKVMLKGLDALAMVHPFIGVAVVAFKLVVTLDMIRRENNKKVVILKVEMGDMMRALFQLRHIEDASEMAPDGTNLKGRMQSLMEKIAHDITEAGSACDLYMKKSFLAKTIKSKIYEGRLAALGARFEEHRVHCGPQTT